MPPTIECEERECELDPGKHPEKQKVQLSQRLEHTQALDRAPDYWRLTMRCVPGSIHVLRDVFDSSGACFWKC